MNNLPQTIKSQLKGLKDLHLTEAEKQQQKQLLLAEIGVDAPSVKRDFIAKEVFSVFIKDWTSSMTWQSIGAMFLFFGIVIGPGVATVSASRASLPGDTLYPVKRNIEKAKVSMRFSEKAKVELEINHVENRVNELARLTKEQAPSPERTLKVFLALEELKKDTASVKGRISKIKDDSAKDTSTDKKKKKDAAKVALLVQEKTVSVQESIKTTVKDLATEGDKEAKADVKEALDSVNEVAIDALEVIVDSHEEDDEVVNQEEVTELVKKQLENTKEIVEVLKDEVDEEEATAKEDEDASFDVSEQDAEEEALQEDEVVDDVVDGDETEEALDSSEEGASLEEAETTQEASSEEQVNQKEKKQAVKKIIEEDLTEDIEAIEQLIEMDNLSQAVEKLAEAKSQVSELNKELKGTVEKPESTEEQPKTEEQESEEELVTEEETPKEDTETEEKQLIEVIQAE